MSFLFGSLSSRFALAFVLTLSVLLTPQQGSAQSNVEAEVLKVNQAFERALSARDLPAMESLWSQDARAMVIHPNAKAVDAGWDAVQKSWIAVFERFVELNATMRDARVAVVGDVAWVVGVEDVSVKRKDGSSSGYTALATNVFVRRDGRWLMVLHQVSRIP